MPLLALTLLVAAADARADTSFVQAWGSGVATGAPVFEHCTTSCRAAVQVVGGDGPVQYPEDAAVDGSGNVLVVDSGNQRVVVYTADGDFVRAFGTGSLTYPWGIAVAPSGNVLVADFYGDRVAVFGSAGTYLSSFGTTGSGAGQLDHPRELALDASGNVFVVDSVNNRIAEFSAAGAFVRNFGSAGSAAGQLNNPQGIAVSPVSGNVIVGDTDNNRVNVYSATGGFVRSFGSVGAAPGQVNRPASVAVDAAGRIVLSDAFNGRLDVFTETGTFVRAVGSAGSGAGQISSYAGVGLDGQGRAFAADVYGHRVSVFRYLFPTTSPAPAAAAFGDVTTGTTGSSTLTITNGGDGALSFSAFAITGADSGAFSRTGGTCDTSAPVAPGATCTVTIAFSPATRGAKSATLTMTDTTLAGTSTVALSGTGRGPVASFGVGSVSFGGFAPGASSPLRTITLTNPGETPLSISSIAVGGADAGQFSRAAGADGGTCSTSTPVASGASCTIGMRFSPTVNGTKNATLTILSNAPAGPVTLPLSGVGDTPTLAFSETALAFGEQPVQSTYGVKIVNVVNTSNAELVISSVALTGADAEHFWTSLNVFTGCAPGKAVAPGEYCTVTVIFTPRWSGAKTAALTIGSNASPSVSTLAMTGTGAETATVAANDPASLPAGDGTLPVGFGTEPAPETGAPETAIRPALAFKGSPSTKAGKRITVDPAIAVACPDGPRRCTATLTATARIGGKKATVGRSTSKTAAGRAARLTFTLTSAGDRALRRAGKLKVTIAVTTANGGAATKASKTITIKAPTKNRR